MTKKWWNALILLILFIFSVAMLYPFLYMLLGSFKTNAEILLQPPTFFPQTAILTNYETVLAKNAFGQYFGNSLFITVIKTAIVLYSSAFFGYVFSKISFRFKEGIFLLVLSTMMIPWPVTLTPLYQMMSTLRWVGTWWSLIVPSAFSTFGIFMMRQFMRGVPDDLMEAARIDGAGEYRVFHQIMMPNITPALSALGIFQFLWTWDDYLWPFLMISDKKMYTLPIALSLYNGQYSADNGGIFASASIAAVPVIIVYLLFQRRFVEGITMTGLKG